MRAEGHETKDIAQALGVHVSHIRKAVRGVLPEPVRAARMSEIRRLTMRRLRSDPQFLAMQLCGLIHSTRAPVETWCPPPYVETYRAIRPKVGAEAARALIEADLRGRA
jgi:hypothetical protein